MILFTAPAAYERYLRSVIAMELARIGRDVEFRVGCDADLRKYSPIEEALIDRGARGQTVILFAVTESNAFEAANALSDAKHSPSAASILLTAGATL